jgi:hypothetical protein
MKLARMFVLVGLLGAPGCETENATTVVVDNDYPPIPDGGDVGKEMTVFKVWWVTSFMPDPVSPGNQGQPQRTVPNSDFAYAVLVPGWDPSAATAPMKLVAATSTVKLGVARGDVLHVQVSDTTFHGNCAVGQSLPQDDADFITQRIFPGDFAGVAYDAKSCTTTAVDGGYDSDTTTSDAAAPDGIVSADSAADGVGE